MSYMFWDATSFNGNVLKWDVSSVTNMDSMFFKATSFNQKLCGAAWVHSMASKELMFVGSSGSISYLCTAPPPPTTTQATRHYVTRRPILEREFIPRTPITPPVSTSAFTSMVVRGMGGMACPKCGMFKKSGRVSCCAPGGAWYKNCGGVGNRNAGRRWFEGVEACKCKFEANGVLYVQSHSE